MPAKGRKKKEMVQDANGNMVEKGSKTDPEQVSIRAAAAARREAKMKAAEEARAKEQQQLQEQNNNHEYEHEHEYDGKKLAHPVTIGDPNIADDGSASTTSDNGPSKATKKLTRKQRKELERKARMAEQEASEAAVRDDELGQFSLSFNGSATGGSGPQSPNDVIVSGFTIGAPAKNLLSDASLKLFHGRRYGLLGHNGSGKSTLLRFLAEQPCRMPVPEGLNILLVEQETAASNVSLIQQVLTADTTRTTLLQEEQAIWKVIGETDDDDGGDKILSAEEWTKKVNRLGEISKELESIGAASAEAKVCRILSGLGFTPKMQAEGTTKLSGGWRVRVSLARALFVEPPLLLLDEPTNHLDLNAVIWLEDHLAKNFKGTLLVVSHDADFLDNACTDVIELDNQSLFYYGGDVYKFLAGRQSREAKRAGDYALQEKTLKQGLAKGLSKKVAQKKALAATKRAALLDPPKEYKVKFDFKNPEDHDPTIAVLDVNFGHEAGPQLFKDLRFSVGTHSRVAIVGANGAGKTTLLQLLTNQLKPTSGEVSLHRKLKIGRFDQHFEELLPMDKTPVSFLRSEYDLNEHDARKSLGQFGLDGPRHLIRIGELSGGQKARVVFASLSLQKPTVLILDEPTNHLDMESVEALVEGIKNFTGGVVLVSHDARLIMDSECDVWICEGADSVAAGGTGLRIEENGFEKYRRDMLAEVQAMAEAEEKRARLRAEKAQKKAVDRMKNLEKRRALKNS